MLIQQLSISRHLATDRYYRTLYESLLDPRLITSSKQALYLNLLYRSLKSDVDVRRVKAFVKRMLQVLNLHQPSFVCGILYLIIDLCDTFPDIKTLMNEPEEHEDEVVPGVATDAPIDTTIDGHEPESKKNENVYDGRKRNPEFSNAHQSCLWELLPFLRHFHPSVDVFASNLLSGQKAALKPELASHTLIAFLDKFVYRNAKAVDTTKGVSIMQPVAASGHDSILLSNRPSVKAVGSTLNSVEFWNKKSEDVAVDDVFFHEYFARVGKSEQAARKKSKASKDGADGEDDEEAAEDEIWDALVASRPEVEGDSDDGADFDDLMSDDDDEEFKKQMDEIDDDDDVSEDGDGVEFWDDSEDNGEEDEEEEEEGGAKIAKKEGETEEKEESEHKKRRRAIKNLPMFASADDYAEMMAQDDQDEDGGF